ncbi:MAG TPA: hypothetical protein ENJ30_02285, partial [Desulfobulbaceae bacterium]|nr:hypothetical protein [Desulfobulbaceae bacterium]
MKKIAVILGSCALLFTIIIIGTGFWVRSHMGEITRQMTGMEMHFSSLSVSYSPMPTIVLTNVTLKKGHNSLKIPALKLYPDFSRIFSGHFQVRKAILENPLIIAQEPAPKPSTGKAFRHYNNVPIANTIPAGIIMVNNGRLLFKSAQTHKVLPISVTAQAEKMGQSLSVQLKNASIDEIGLKFSGNVSIESFVPLRLTVKATKGTFNPDTLKDFLIKFGYLSNKAAVNIPNIKNLAFNQMQLTVDTASGRLDFSANNINVDQMKLQKVAVKLSADGNFSVRCSEGIVDVGSAYGWLQQNPEGEKVLKNILGYAKLKTLTARGEVQLSALHFQGSYKNNKNNKSVPATLRVDGSVNAKTRGVILHLVAGNGAEQDFTIGQLDAKIIIRQSKPSIQVEKLKFNSSGGGKGSIKAVIAVPLNLKRISLQSSIDALKIFDTTVNLHVNKAGQPKSDFDLKLTSPALKIAAAGVAYIPGRKKNDLDLRLTNLYIATLAAKSRQPPCQTKAAFAQHFDFSAIEGRKFFAKAFIKNGQIGNFTSLHRLKNVNLQVKSEHNRTVLHGTVQIYGLNLIVAAVTSRPDQLITNVDVKGTDVNLTSFIACFSKELPVFLSGRLYLTG